MTTYHSISNRPETVEAPQPARARSGVAAGTLGLPAAEPFAWPEPPTREIWQARRRYMESHREKRLPDGRRHPRRFPMFMFLIRRFGALLKLLGVYRRGMRNALELRLNRVELAFADLPDAFDGYTILQMSDLHLDSQPEGAARLADLVRGLEVDLCALTGDYREHIVGAYEQILAPLESVLAGISVRDGTYAILGNHDTVDMVEPFEAMGMRVMTNETVTLSRGGACIHLVGLDDVHYYFTEQALGALQTAPEGFRVALVHSPEIVEAAAAAGVSLYLSGHTHGGQICLPGGIPIITHLVAKRAYANGVWRCGDMTGYTSTGAGTSGLPVRFNTRGEVALITLRRKPATGAGAPS